MGTAGTRRSDQQRKATGVFLGVFALPLVCAVVLVILQVVLR